MTKEILELMRDRRMIKGTRDYYQINKITKGKCKDTKGICAANKCSKFEELHINKIQAKVYSMK